MRLGGIEILIISIIGCSIIMPAIIGIIAVIAAIILGKNKKDNPNASS